MNYNVDKTAALETAEWVRPETHRVEAGVVVRKNAGLVQ